MTLKSDNIDKRASHYRKLCIQYLKIVYYRIHYYAIKYKLSLYIIYSLVFHYFKI